MALLIKAALFAAVALAPNSTLYSDGTPPERFQGNGVAAVIFTDGDGIERLCGKSPPGMQMLACTHVEAGKVSIMAMPNPCLFQYDYYAHLACHELGHAQGWPRTHGS